MRSSMWFAPVIRGVNCRMIFPRGSPSITTTGDSSGMGCGGRFMTDFERESGRKPARSPHPASVLSTASRSRRLKKGGPWVQRGQEDTWAQAACDRRYAWDDHRPGRASGEYPGPHWWPPFRFEEVLYAAAHPPIQVGDEPGPRWVEVDHGVQQLPASDGHGIVQLRCTGAQTATDDVQHVLPAAHSVVEKRRRDSSLHG